MIKKPNSNYESPLVEWLKLDVSDVLTTSGENFYEWDWDTDKPYDDGLFQ